MPKKRNEVILIRARGGKLVKVCIIPHNQKQGEVHLETDTGIQGSMETRYIPDRFDSLIDWLEHAGKLRELEAMIKEIFQ